MLPKNIFIKVSGDQYLNPAFIKWLKQLSKKSHLTILVGGGTQINEEFARRGFPVKKHGPLGRETETLEQRQIARDVLEKNQAILQDRLAQKGISAEIIIPIVYIGTVLCPVNGDQMVRTAYLGFDELYVITTPERAKNKKEVFTDLPKVKIKTFPHS